MAEIKRTTGELSKLALIQMRAKVIPSQIGYWDDLAYRQGNESVYKAQRIADVQEAAEIAKEILDFVKADALIPKAQIVKQALEAYLKK